MIPVSRRGEFSSIEGFEVRDLYKKFFNNEGAVSWQQKYKIKLTFKKKLLYFSNILILMSYNYLYFNFHMLLFSFTLNIWF